jgi:hypothetical protein
LGEEPVVVPALIEVHDRVELRHRGRLLRRTGDHADVTLARMPEQVGAGVVERIGLQPDAPAVLVPVSPLVPALDVSSPWRYR